MATAFQFPSNPEDGHMLIRDNLQAYYDATADTWVVYQLQQVPGIEGPEGPEGPKGDSVVISGVVDTEADLPPAFSHQGEWWIVDDTNTLHYSDGFGWTDLGGPIQGTPGQGWTSVTENDTGDTYTITFNSDTPELEFTTPNLKGAAGTTNNPDDNGPYDIGFSRLNFEKDGVQEATTAYAGYGYQVVVPWVSSQVKSVKMPDNCNAAVVMWEATSKFDVGSSAEIAEGKDKGYVNGQVVILRCHLDHTLEVTDALFYSTVTPVAQVKKEVFHNFNGIYDTSSGVTNLLEDQYIGEQFTKVDYIEFTEGADVTFKHSVDISEMATGTIYVGDLTLTIIPFNKDDATIGRFELPDTQTASTMLPSRSTLTAEDIKRLNVADLKNRIGTAIGEIEDLIANESDQTVIDDLTDIKTKLLSARTLPGNYATVHTAIANQIDRLNINYLNNTFNLQ